MNVKRRIVFSLAAFLVILGLVALGYRQLSSSGNAGYVIIGIGDWVLETSLYFVIITLTFLFLALHLTAMRAEIAARKIRQIHIAEIGER